MAFHPLFLSVTCVMANRAATAAQTIREMTEALAPLVSDYELIIVDNASSDDTVAVLKSLTGESGVQNLQVFALTKEVDADTAAWAGLENALGDFVVVIDPFLDDIAFLPQMLERAVSGADVVFAANNLSPHQNLPYRLAFLAFNGLFKWFNGIYLPREAPQFRVLSRMVVNSVLQHARPAVAYRHLPASGGFAKVNLVYSAAPKPSQPKHLLASVDRGMRLLVSTTRVPMRLVTMLSLFGATANVLYSIYVVGVALFKEDVAPGWISLSLQQSGMFVLISLVLLVLGEYVLNMASLTNESSLYHIGQEFTSARITRREKLNVEEVRSANAGARLYEANASR